MVKDAKRNDSKTEDQIFDAACTVFHENGFDGARMQEIARRANINQSMLHYYYRTKSKLFEVVFRKAVAAAMPPLLEILKSDLPLLEKIEFFAYSYIDMIERNPHVPAFILEELRKNPQRLSDIAGEHAKGVFAVFSAQVDRAVQEDIIRPTTPEHLFVNMISMCIFPFVARPMLQTVLEIGDTGYDELLASRKKEVAQFILNSVKK